MKRHPNLVLGFLLAVVLALGAWQGQRVSRLYEAETFYRWILAEATQSTLWSDKPTVQAGEGEPMKDREFFQSLAQKCEPLLSGEAPAGHDGKPTKKLVAFATDQTKDQEVWELARSRSLASERKEFFTLLRAKKLTSASSEFDPGAMYSSGEASVSLSNIFFGFRKVAANFVWLQVDRYWHQGAMHRMIPLMKLCVQLDPTFIDAYLVGAWHLAYNATAKMMDTPEPLKKYNATYGVRLGEKELYYYMAIDFLKDGIRKNPRNYQLYFDLGFAVYNNKLKDYANAVKYLSEAVRQRHDIWVERQLYICMELNHQYDEALEGWEDYQKKHPENTVAPRFIERNKGLIKEREWAKALELAKEAQNPQDAAAYRAEADRLRTEAEKIWQSMAGDNNEPEPFALGRILRMKALQLIDEGRYLEAIAVLQNAWTKSGSFAEEALNMIIDTKLEAGIPLSTSEKKAVLRREEAEKYKNQPPPSN